MVERCLSFRVRRFLMLVLVVLLAFGPFTRAYADDFEGGGGGSHDIGGSYPNFGTVWYSPKSYMGNDNLAHYRYGVVAFTKYDAAIYSCMGSDFAWDDLSNRKKSKLLNDSDFSAFANLFATGKPAMTSDWSGDAAIVMAWNSARELYGETYCFNADYTYQQRLDAVEAIRRILAEDDNPSGGGSGGGGLLSDGIIDIDGYKLIPLEVFKPDPTRQVDYIALTDTNYDKLVAVQSDTSKWCAYVSSNCGDFGIYAATNDNLTFEFYEEYKPPNATGGTYCLVFDGDTTNTKYFHQNYKASYMKTLVDGEGEDAVTYENCFLLGGDLNSNSWGTIKRVFQNNCNYRWNGKDVVQEPEPDPEPPVVWPTPPTTVTPVPPEVPTPGDPTTPIPPDPVEPTPGNPWIPIPDEDITITGEDFQDLIDALNEHCIHLQTSIQSNVSQLWDLQSDFLGTQFSDLFGQISDNFAWLGNDVIAESYNDLKSYLHELFEWLSEQLNFDVQVDGGQYDDTSVLYWLKQIWAKLPTGINTKPSDPVTNPTGWWDWLTQLLNNLAADLMALGHDKLAGVLETLNQLRNKFPFSLPWDIAALLGLLVGVPECPEFDMPCFTVTLQGLQEVGTYHITLEPYETVWEGVKWIETLAFAVYLITHTGGLMEMVNKTVRPR